MDKHKIIQSHSALIDEEGVFLKTLDQLYEADQYFEVKVTDFLTPDIVMAIEKIARYETQVKTTVIGVFDFAERSKLIMTPEYSEEQKLEDHIALLEISYTKKFNSLAHKDLLGALLGLGIQRKKVGDIIVLEESFQVAIDASLAEFVVHNLERVGRAGVHVRRLPIEKASSVNIPFEWLKGTVKSLRLDALVAFAFNMSRSEAKAKIESESVKVNYRPISYTSYVASLGDLISVRGSGRFRIDEILGETKKERLRIVLKLYSKN